MNALLTYRTYFNLALSPLTATATPVPTSTSVVIPPAALQIQSDLIIVGAGLLLLIIWMGVLWHSNLIKFRLPRKTRKED